MRAQLVVTAGVLAMIGACSSSPTGPDQAGRQYILFLKPARATIEGGNSLLFRATVIDADGKSVPAPTLTWSSSDQTVASVDGGMVRGGREGSAEIAATWNGARGSSVVSVLATKQSSAKCPQLAVAAGTGPKASDSTPSCTES